MCEYCDHETNEEAKRFPLFADRGKDEAFIDEDNYLSVYTQNGDWVAVAIKYCPMCGERIKGCGHLTKTKRNMQKSASPLKHLSIGSMAND